MRKRILILCGTSARHNYTCATLVRAGLNVVGICRCHSRLLGLPVATVTRSVAKGTATKTLGQVAGRMLYLTVHSVSDRRVHRQLFPESEDENTIARWGGPVLHTRSYQDSETLTWLRALAPDLLVVHSSSWVGKLVRSVPKDNIVIGGHPGLTPHYRGSHSAFWAVYRNRPEDVGWSVFHVDQGVDTGPVIAQGCLSISLEDTYFTLAWKGMKCIAENQARVLIEWERGEEIPRRAHDEIPPDSLFPLPTLGDHFIYWRNMREIKRHIVSEIVNSGKTHQGTQATRLHS